MTELFPYQQQGADWLAKMRQALLADDPGLGKSAQAITAADAAGHRRILVICPANARVNWEREFKLWSILDRPIFTVLTGQQMPKTVKWPDGVLIISYDLLSYDRYRKLLMREDWGVLILDEAHYVKERKSKRTKAVYESLAPKAQAVWRITGTPMMNNAGELWTHLHSAGLFPQSYHKFLDMYCHVVNDGWGDRIVGVKNPEHLKALVKQFMLRRRKADVLAELPPIVQQHVTVEASPVDNKVWFTQEALTPHFEKKFLADLADAQRRLDFAVGQAITMEGEESLPDVIVALQQPMATLRRHVGLSKVDSIADIIGRELEENQYDKIVIFAVHRMTIKALSIALEKHNPLIYWGGTPPEDRQRIVDKFQTQAKFRVFIGQVVAAGTNLTLTAASEVAFAESSWVPMENAQAAMRCHRIGQKKSVRVRTFSVANSTDEKITQALVRKMRDITKIIE